MRRWITPLLAATVVLLVAGFVFSGIGNRPLIRRPPPPAHQVPAATLTLPALPRVIEPGDTAVPSRAERWPATAAGLRAAMQTRSDALSACVGGTEVVVAFTLVPAGDHAVISRTRSDEATPALTACVQHAVADLEFTVTHAAEMQLRYPISP